MAAPSQDFHNAGRSQIVGRVAFGAAERFEGQGVRSVDGTTGGGDEWRSRSTRRATCAGEPISLDYVV